MNQGKQEEDIKGFVLRDSETGNPIMTVQVHCKEGDMQVALGHAFDGVHDFSWQGRPLFVPKGHPLVEKAHFSLASKEKIFVVLGACGFSREWTL